MAEGKKSVLLYCDIIHTVEELDDVDAGLLFKHYLRYINDQNPEAPNKLIKIVFEPIKQNLKRDLKKWESEIHSRSIAGKIGGVRSGEARRSKLKQKQANEASASKSKQTEANEAVTVNVNVNERDGSPQILSVFDAEKTIISNQIRFEQICMKTSTNQQIAKEALRKFHLHLASKDEYPKSKQAVFAGFEKWLMNEKSFQPKVIDLKNDQQAGPKLKTI